MATADEDLVLPRRVALPAYRTPRIVDRTMSDVHSPLDGRKFNAPWRVSRGEIVGADGDYIAWGYHEDMGALLQKIKPAHARLIAAAPEMLLALEAILAGAEGQGAHVWMSWSMAATIARDAIKRARGK